MMAEENIALSQLENVVPTQKIIGKGAYGRVIEVTTCSAAKELHQNLIDFANPQELARLQEKFLGECNQCNKLSHPNIVQFLGVYYPSEDAKLPWLVMEKMNCSLHEYLNVHKPSEVSFQTKVSIMHDVTLGLQYLHVQDIIHRDLSSNNILLTKQLVAKIADLGVAKVIEPSRIKSHTQAPGTVIFMPPEALSVNPRYGKPVDVFSLGCVMIHMMTHKWPNPKDEVSINEITGIKTARDEKERREDYLELINEPVELKEIILKCLNNLPKQRPSISGISKVLRELNPDLKLEKMCSILFEYEPLLSLKDGYKEREDRTAELEEFINDQVAELDKMEAVMKQTVANKQLLEKDYQKITANKQLLEKDHEKLNEHYKNAKTQLDQLTKELAVERSVIENAKSEMDKLMDQLQQLRREKRILDQQMKDGYKEREDRIAELEEFINDQVTELDKMEAAMKLTVANKQLLEKDYQKITANKQLLEKDHEKLNEHYKNAKNLVKQYEQRHIAQEEMISMARQREEHANKAREALEQEKEGLIQANQKMSKEIARLMSVDVELDKCKVELRKAEEELQTKEFMLNTYKEDFEAERKARENDYNIKEDEITKARIKMEEFAAECQEKIENVKQSVEVEMNTLKQQVDQLAIERDKFKKENDRLRAELEKEKKDAQNKFDVYKKKTEQFQLQWKKREEAEDKINNLVEQHEQRIISQEETISMARKREENANKAIATLEKEKEGLIQTNQKMSREVARLMSVDVELDKCKVELRKAEEELQTKEFLLNTYKEDFEAERKARENDYNIKEDEITKARIKMEEFAAECQEKIENVKQSVEVEMNTLKQQISHLIIDRDKFEKESEKLRSELDKEKKDAQNKIDLYKKKTEQFQLQWKKREEAEVKLNTLAEQLNNQHELNRQLSSTIDTLMRKTKGIEPQIPSNNIATQLSSQQRRMSPHDPPFSSMTTPADPSSNQYHAPSTVSSSDPSLAHTNAGMGFQQRLPPSSTSQPSWQRQQYQYKMQQQQQEEHLHLRGQGRGAIHNQPLKPQHEATYYPSDYQGQGIKYIPPANLDNYQPKSMQPHTEYNVAGTNAAPMQFPQDDYNHGRSSGPASLDSSITTKPRPSTGYTNPSPLNQSPLTGARRPEKPTQYASEGINEEIRYQADKQRRYQEYERFDSNLQLDPYLICPKCRLQFREGQLPEYRHHIDNCDQ